MDHPSRDEMEARLEAIEARSDARAAAFQATVDAFIAVMNERTIHDNQRFAQVDERFARIETAIAEMREQIRSLRMTMVVTALSTAIAIILGIGTLNAALMSNMIAALESGKDIAAAQAELKRQSEETAGLIREMQRRLDLQAPAAR
jgi:hypothetical protein